MVRPTDNAIWAAKPIVSMGVEQRFAARIASGAAIGNRYRADPAKNTISAPAKKISTQALRKSRPTHEDSTTTPNPSDAQNIGFGSKNAPPAAASAPSAQFQRRPRISSGETIHAECTTS